MNTQTMLFVMQMILSFGNVCILCYGFFKFLNKPHSTLETKHEELKRRVDEHDVKLKEIDESLHENDEQFRKQDQTNAVFKSVMLSFVNYEIAYCIHTGYEHTDDLYKAKKELEDYLVDKH